MPVEGDNTARQEVVQMIGAEVPVDAVTSNNANNGDNNRNRGETGNGGYEFFNGNNTFGYKSNGRYVPWLVRRALKQLGGENRCRLEVVTSCSGIIEVVLSRRNLDSVPPEVFDFLSLETLRLDNNNLQTLDANVGRLQSLKCLLLGKNQLSTLPASLANCRHLMELDVQCNRLASVPASVWRLKRLASLNMSWNQLMNIPPDIARLKDLRFLDLEGNILSDCTSTDSINAPSSLPTEMVLLEHLHVLNLGENGLMALPPIICRLSTLRAVNLAGNKLADLPPSFMRLEYLSELSLASNQLASVPACLSELKSLRYLNLSRNLLRVLPASLAQLDRLQILLAAGNNLIAISDCLSQNLRVLDVSHNKLRNLCVGKLKNLNDLNVSYNRLEVLPMGIGVSKGSKRLVRLSGACNKITRLNPEEIVALTRLQHLDLSGNNIATMSGELLRFMAKRLKEYCLQGNPIAANQTVFPMCRHIGSKSDKEGLCKHHLNKQASNLNTVVTNNNNNKCEIISRQRSVSARPSSLGYRSAQQQHQQQVEAEVVVNSSRPSTIMAPPDVPDVHYANPDDDSVEIMAAQTPGNEIANLATETPIFPPPPPSVIGPSTNNINKNTIIDYSTHITAVESQQSASLTDAGLLQTVPTPPPPLVPPPIMKEPPIHKFSQLRSPDITRERRHRAGTFSPTEARLNDATTRVLRVGSAGGAFTIDFSPSAQQPVRAASPSPASPQPGSVSPYRVKVFVPPQALAHSSNIIAKFLYVDDVALMGLLDKKLASHVVSFSPVVFMKASPFLSAASPVAVANRQASTPLTTRLYEDLTITLNLSPQAEAAIARRSCNIHVFDVLPVAGSVLESTETPARIVCSPHPRVRMGSYGQHISIKFGHLGNGVGIIVSKSSNSRKACRAAEKLIRAELNRRSSNNATEAQCTEF